MQHCAADLSTTDAGGHPPDSHPDSPSGRLRLLASALSVLLRSAVADHVSDAFVDLLGPVDALSRAAASPDAGPDAVEVGRLPLDEQD